MNGPKRSVTPEPFSAGITPKVISGYLVFQSSAKAEVANASEAIPAIRILRFIMMHPSGLGGGTEKIGHERSSGRGDLAEGRNSSRHFRRRRADDVIGFEIVEFARDVLG